MTTPSSDFRSPARAATPADASDFFGRRLRYETDPSDTHAAQRAGENIVVVDVRSAEAFAQGHVPRALHMPYREIGARAARELTSGADVVVYCWGPGCNAGAKGGLALSEAGFAAKEMIGGFEYWAREGFPVEDATGIRRRPIDSLTGVVGPLTPACGC